jgi:squalene-hopene/tetraprenyl-beta-curcumene cyclase
MLNKIPYGDLKAMIDPPTADLTGRVLEMLGRTRYPVDRGVVDRAIRFLQSEQEAEGCWYGRWGVNYLYGTSIVLGGLSYIGRDMNEPWIRKATDWLRSVQNSDGGWGEACETYKSPELKGTGVSTPSQTGWTLVGLMDSGDYDSDSVNRGIQYLIEKQNRNGSWPEPQFTGTGFPGHFFINYHLYRNSFPLTALGRYFAHHSK